MTQIQYAATKYLMESAVYLSPLGSSGERGRGSVLNDALQFASHWLCAFLGRGTMVCFSLWQRIDKVSGDY